MDPSITEIASAVGIGLAAVGITVERAASFMRQRRWTNGGHPNAHLADAVDRLTGSIDRHEKRSERRDDRHEERDERRHETVLGALMSISDRD